MLRPTPEAVEAPADTPATDAPAVQGEQTQ
jgi:hypothetical protein